jgi:hypothetical protein
MHYCNNDYFCVLDSVIDTEREVVNHGASSVSMNGRIHDGCLGDRCEDRSNLVEELLSEPRPLPFIP